MNAKQVATYDLIHMNGRKSLRGLDAQPQDRAAFLGCPPTEFVLVLLRARFPSA